MNSQEVPVEDIHKLFHAVLSLSRASNWLLGDTLNLADRTWGNQHTCSKYEEAEKHTGLSINTLKQIVWVCKSIPLSRRRHDLSFAHHIAVLGTADTAKEQDVLLNEAKQEGMSSKQFRKHLRKVKQKKAQATMYHESGENYDRPFGVMNLPEERVADYPLSIEITRISAWFEGRDLRRLPAAKRKEMLSDLVHIFRDAYALFQLERRSNPDAEFDLPFDIQSLEAAPPEFMRK